MASAPRSSKYILLVPDSLFWVTGRIARKISEALRNFCIESMICSGPVLSDLLSCHPGFVNNIKAVHFLTPHLATQFKEVFVDRCPFISTIHHIESSLSVEPSSYSDAIMTVSHQWHNELIRNDVPDYKLVMIKNGIDVDLFHPGSPIKKQKARKKFGIPSDEFIVGFSAKKTSDTCDRKGIDVLSSVIKSSSRIKGNKISWLVRGPGWNQLIGSLQEEGARIYYCPFLVSDAELAESYQALDAFVVTARIEGGPVPLLEAMSCGLPVVSTRVGVASEIVEQCKNGFLVDFDAPEEILRNLQFIADNPSCAESVGSKARKTIIQKLQWKDTTKDITNLYDVAENNFHNRISSVCGTPDCEQPGNLSPLSFRRWIVAREYAYFANFLERQGAHAAAMKMATKAFIYAPTDMGLLKSISAIVNPRKLLASAVKELKCRFQM